MSTRDVLHRRHIPTHGIYVYFKKKKTGPCDLRFSVKILLGYAVVEAMYGIEKSVLCRTNKIKVSFQLLNVDFKYLLIRP